MQEIAREAGYTAPSLYTYFEGKDALLRELFDRFLEEVLEVFDKPTPRGLTLEQALELLLHEVMALCDRRQDALVAFASVAQTGPLPTNIRAITEKSASGPAILIRRFTAWFEDKAQPGELGELSQEDAAYYLFGIGSALLMRWDHKDRKDELTDIVPSLLDLFFYGTRGSRET